MSDREAVEGRAEIGEAVPSLIRGYRLRDLTVILDC